GAWECNVGFKVNMTYQVTSHNARHPGVTALAGTAFLAGGHLPGRGPYGKVLDRAIDYILSVTDDKGFISENDTRMYSHAFAALFLAEVYGSSLQPEMNEKVRGKLDRAVQFLLRAQNEQGGWRYEANAVDSDMSVTVCQVMALRAARNKGIKVPQKNIDAAVKYVLESAVTRGGRSWGFGDGEMRRGAFKYQYRERNPIGTRASLALTGAAMTTLFGAGLYDDGAILGWARDHGIERFAAGGEKPPTIREMAQYILDEYDGHTRSYPRHYFWFYGHYYSCQAMYIAGGPAWEAYYPLVREHLLRNQDADGSWEVNQVGRTFGTAVACVILQVPLRFLPVLDQR
ncbi:MAG: terpene cyclase/mutase family protein, partial [Planctomycetes bacterium]|nr:terpene cyclase/mutase family protein [Planctomycetota bacterium]